MIDVHEDVNVVDRNKNNSASKYGSKCVGTILATEGVLELTVGSKPRERNKSIDSDYRRYLMNVDNQ